MLVRAGELSSTMSRYLIQRLTENPAIDLHFNTEITALEGGERLEGIVWQDRTTGERVAIKVLRTDIGQSLDGAAKERFLREARVLAQLSHPSIIRYVSHGMTADGAPYLAMEWIEGGDDDSK